MCGRYNNHRQAMLRWVEILGDWAMVTEREGGLRFNVPPTTQIPIVTVEGVRWARWGMVPVWAEEFKSKFSTIIARIETVEKLPAFRGAWRAGRTCLVPAAGYYEWPEYLDKQPYYIHKPGDMPLADLHDRMPVMLSPDMAERWLAEGTKMNSSGSGVCFEVEFYPVNKAVNSVRNEGPELVERIEVTR